MVIKTCSAFLVPSSSVPLPLAFLLIFSLFPHHYYFSTSYLLFPLHLIPLISSGPSLLVTPLGHHYFITHHQHFFCSRTFPTSNNRQYLCPCTHLPTIRCLHILRFSIHR